MDQAALMPVLAAIVTELAPDEEDTFKRAGERVVSNGLAGRTPKPIPGANELGPTMELVPVFLQVVTTLIALDVWRRGRPTAIAPRVSAMVSLVPPFPDAPASSIRYT
jgi:hypothetical protein